MNEKIYKKNISSILQLEEDIMEYRNYREKYNLYFDKSKKPFAFLNKKNIEINIKKYYKKYMNKMQYLERTYIYTNYDKQLNNCPRIDVPIYNNKIVYNYSTDIQSVLPVLSTLSTLSTPSTHYSLQFEMSL